MSGDTAQALQATPGRAGVVSLLDHDPDLGRGIPSEDRALAHRTLVVPALTFEPGPVELRGTGLRSETFALLVIDGELTSDVRLDGRSLTEVLMPGDIETPWEPDLDGLPATREIIAATPARLAALDGRFLLAAARWPSLMTVVQRRLADQKQRLAVHGAICQFPRVGDRLLAMLHHIAERTGRVTAEGTIVPSRLTHESLGKLVGARRPTVSLAIKELTDAGRVRRNPDGTWLLLGEHVEGSG